jgi:acyl carrier protein phosphodiesterase
VNLLAHAYLSFGRPEMLVGNMISDFVKGKKKFDYSEGIQQGISLHRAIDAFTDDHPATREAKTFFHPAVRLYSGAFVDVTYDHFLANDSSEFKHNELEITSQNTYKVLNDYFQVLPLKLQQMLPYMQSQNWLYNYKTINGIEKSFGGVVRRSLYLNSSDAAFGLFKSNYSALQNCYFNFFPDVKAFTIGELNKL